MDFLTAPILTFNIFGGLDVNLLGLLIFILPVIAAGIIYTVRNKKSLPKRTTGVICAAVIICAFAASCAYSVIADTTPAVSTDRYIELFGAVFNIDRVALTINIGNGFSVYWYGVIIACGFLLALLYGFRNAERFGVDKEKMMDVVLVGLIAAIVCARAYYLAFDGVPMDSFMDFFAIHDGGIAIYGGVIGAFVFGGLTARLKKINVLSMFDLGVLGFLIGQGIGRWGNFVNQEVYGKPTGSTWFGMSGSQIAVETQSFELVHPLFLYESIWCLVAFIVLHKVSKKRAFNGQITCLYMMIYGAGRFVFEGMRNTSFILMLGKAISISQLVSVGAVIAGAVIYALLYKRSKTVDESYESQFGEQFDDDMLADAYGLLNVEFDCDSAQLEAAYNEKVATLENMEADTQEKKEKIEAKLGEIKRAYEYISASRASEDKLED